MAVAEIVGPSLRCATTRITMTTKATRIPATDDKPHDLSEYEA